MTRDGVFVLGASGHAKVVISTLLAAGKLVVGMYDDDPAKQGTSLLGIPVLGPISEFARLPKSSAVLAIGSNEQRKRLACLLGGVTWATAVHPSAQIHGSVSLGLGTVVFAGAIIQPDSIIGDHCILNTGCSIDHDCSVSNFVHIAPRVTLAGNITVGEGTFVGIASTVIQGVRVGAWAQVGAGGVVVRDMPDRVLAVGVPARVIKERA